MLKSINNSGRKAGREGGKCSFHFRPCCTAKPATGWIHLADFSTFLSIYPNTTERDCHTIHTQNRQAGRLLKISQIINGNLRKCYSWAKETPSLQILSTGILKHSICRKQVPVQKCDAPNFHDFIIDISIFKAYQKASPSGAIWLSHVIRSQFLGVFLNLAHFMREKGSHFKVLMTRASKFQDIRRAQYLLFNIMIFIPILLLEKERQPDVFEYL